VTTDSSPHSDEIRRRTKAEGKRRLSRPPLELAATAVIAGFSVVFGLIALGVATDEAGRLAGSIAFGVAFVFVVVGRSELFTENFLAPIAGLERRDRSSWRKLAELWTLSLLFNLVGGALLVVIVTSEGVLPDGSSAVVIEAAEALDENGFAPALLSAVAAGVLLTLMAWLVEGAESMGVGIACAWIAGSVMVLGDLNHVIVATLGLFFGMRYGADVDWGDIGANFGPAALGNLVGGVLFVTLTRLGQAPQARARTGS
jgi:formate-nitrite transporter family protein